MSKLTFIPRSEFDRVKTMNAPMSERATIFANLARINTLSMIAAAGSGHIGSSFSSLDIVSWLYLDEMRLPAKAGRDAERDIFFSSKGHDAPGLYAVMIALGQLPEQARLQLRRLGGLPGHPDLTLTPFIEANTGSLGMGISKAKGMAIANRLKGRNSRLFVMTGDGELQEGQIWESLGSAVRLGLSEITVIVDHNKVQSDTLVQQTADLGDLEAKFAAFGWNVLRCNGHDFQALSTAITAAKSETGRPTVIIADTLKGCGVSFMEHIAMDGRWYRYHSGAPSPADYDRAIAELMDRSRAQFAAFGAEPGVVDLVERPVAVQLSATPQRMVRAYSEALLAEAAANPDIIALDADLVLDTGLIPFQEQFPDRFVECGIAEMDMVSQASGLALAGMLPVVHSFACFLTPRANEQIFNASTEDTRIIYTGSLAGVVPAGPGHSHQSVRDIALMGSVPNLVALEPCCEAEVAMAVRWAVRDNLRSSYIRLVSIPCDIPYSLPEGYRLQPGRGAVLRGGGDIALIGYGPVLLPQAMIMAERMATEGLQVRVINLPWLNVIDGAWLKDALAGCRAVVTLDNHLLSGGQGEKIMVALAEQGFAAPVRRLGIEGVPACGRNDEVLAHHGLDAAGLAAVVRKLAKQQDAD